MKLFRNLRLLVFLPVIIIVAALIAGCTPDVESLKDKSNIRGLIKALNYKSDINIPVDAARALGEIGDEQAIEPLIKALDAEDRSLANAAAASLGKIGEPAVVPLMEKFKNEKHNWIPINNALVHIGAPSVEPLIGLLSDDDSELRRRTVLALGEIGDTRAVEPVIVSLNDKDENVVQQAFEALGKMKDIKAVETLIYYLSDKETRYWASEALVESGEIAVEPLIKLLNESSTSVISIFIEIGDERAVGPLIDALNNKAHIV